MKLDFFYCSELSRGAGEKTFATASVGDVWLLMEYHAQWGQHAARDSALPPDIKSHLAHALKNIPRSRILFIKQKKDCLDDLSFFVVRCHEKEPSIVRFDLQSYEQLREIDIIAAACEQSIEGAALATDPLFLVCTHGRRDKCCAKFGYPLYKSLKPEAGTSLWQSSHVGGDRFAANLVCFPHGLFYAHVIEEKGRVILDEYRRGHLVLDKYRGRACYSYPAQAAEFFIRRETSLTEIGALSYAGGMRLTETSWRVRFTSTIDESIHEARVSCHQSDFSTFITCHSTEEKSVKQFVLDEYRVLSDRPLVNA